MSRASILLVGLFTGGCDSLNPAFVDLLDPEGSGQFSTLVNPPGHVVIQFINNAEVDERLIDYLESPEGGSLELTDAERRSLRPRFRFSLLVTFEDASRTVLPIEFESAEGPQREPGCVVSVTAFPIEDNVVVVCDVLRVELDPNAPVEVLIPVAISQWELQQFTTGQGGLSDRFVVRDEIPCGWRALQIDDQRGVENPLLRNIDIRDMPGAITDPLCGSTITYELTGQMSVPFLAVAETGPSYDIASRQVEARIGGRFAFNVGIR